MARARAADPLRLFREWYDEAQRTGMKEPTAMALATVSPRGWPSVRMVLLKRFDDEGFVLYTNRLSAKGRDLDANHRAELCFFWIDIGKQVRVRGKVARVSDEEADAYFASRPRLSQIGAWASRQSFPIHGRLELERRVAYYMAKFALRKIPRPPFWVGYRVVPDRFEFWEERPFRLHRRVQFQLKKGVWKPIRLFP